MKLGVLLPRHGNHGYIALVIYCMWLFAVCVVMQRLECLAVIRWWICGVLCNILQEKAQSTPSQSAVTQALLRTLRQSGRRNVIATIVIIIIRLLTNHHSTASRTGMTLTRGTKTTAATRIEKWWWWLWV